MLQALVFFSIVLLVVGPIHWYLWKRMVRDTTRPGRARKIGNAIMFALVALLLGAFILPRAIGAKTSTIIPLAGYLWLAVMFYLLLILLVLELPRALANRALRRRAAFAPAPAQPTLVAESVGLPKISEVAGQSGETEPVIPPIAGQLERSSSPEPEPEPQPGPQRDASAERDAESRRLFLARGAAIFAGLTATGITAYGARTALSGPVVKRVQIPLAKLPRSMDGYRIALASDIHLGPLTGIDHTRRIVNALNGLDADIVAIVGDLVDGSVAELADEAAPLRDLRSRNGAYFVTGNHEYFSGAEEWVAEVERLGLRALRNERLAIHGLDLAGVNDVTGVSEGPGKGPDFARTLDGRDLSRPVVLLAHQPVQAHEAAKHGVDLQLSGHTHGGQLVPFNLIAALQQPVISGLGDVDGTKVYVTNGAGYWGPPVRVGAPPDVTLVELRAP
ncbi:metallophosphoesterase [Catellatospora sp. KI3]|uniref:metallophosphoesterase n=1 Tax=Catellatospora sp. KI3 TaxID=3041620 RepID=UPI002482A53E|nr:metallophosphoesterase [Catellatospora sp. KI3]MDI1461714.1 metallophosphoesterase [Catellatospora sp. KI3]